jgi:O-methyltransferase domain/Dimerisation domain
VSAVQSGPPGTPAEPRRIFELALAFRKSKALLSAVELGVFTALAQGPLDAAGLAGRIGVHPRGARDFFDTLVALELLDRDACGRYGSSADCALYLDERKPTYVGGALEYLNARVYPGWSALTAALRSGAPQSGPFAAGGFDAFHADPVASETFLRGMTGGSLVPAAALAVKFPWRGYRSFLDVGTAQGCVPVAIARAHSHLIGGGFDLPAIEAAFRRYVAEHGVADRLSFLAGDFLADPLPSADVLVLGRVLHDWDVPTRALLLAKAYAALPPGGAVIVWEALIDDARHHAVDGLLSSLNMLIQTAGGSEWTIAECMARMRGSGFEALRLLPLAGAYSAVVGIKPET